LTDFLTDYGVLVALVCSGAAIVYGALVTKRLLVRPAGDERMREISGAVQEGAKAYLNRQYTIIAAVAIPLAVALLFLQNVWVMVGFLIGGILSGAAGFIGMHVSVRANSRVAQAAHHACHRHTVVTGDTRLKRVQLERIGGIGDRQLRPTLRNRVARRKDFPVAGRADPT
jgi:Na+/H+-translocating membrane pyrophosphatase